MSAEVRDELAEIGKQLAVQNEQYNNMSEDIREIKELTHKQEDRCRMITAGYTNSLAKVKGKIIKGEGCIAAIKGLMKQKVLLVVGTATVVGAAAALISTLLKSN